MHKSFYLVFFLSPECQDPQASIITIVTCLAQNWQINCVKLPVGSCLKQAKTGIYISILIMNLWVVVLANLCSQDRCFELASCIMQRGLRWSLTLLVEPSRFNAYIYGEQVTCIRISCASYRLCHCLWWWWDWDRWFKT